MRITITKELEPFWADQEGFSVMSDKDIIELCQEDVTALLDGATWLVTRKPEEMPK
jgi:hypothetical protein